MVDAMPFNLSSERIRATIPFSGAGTLRDILDVRGWDVTVWQDDFNGDALDARYPAVTTGVDGTFTKVASAQGGTCALIPGASVAGDDEYGGVGLGGLEWSGDLNAVMAVRLKVDNILTVKLECGFTDSFADAGAVNVLATPTYTADDAALWVLDTDDTATWQATGVKATTGAGKIEDSDIVAPVNDTWQTLVVALQGDNAKFLQFDADGKKTYESIWLTDAIEGGTAVGPWVMVQNRAAAQDRTLTIDSVFVAQRKT